MLTAMGTIIDTAGEDLNHLALQLHLRFAKSVYLALRTLHVDRVGDWIMVEGEVPTYHTYQVAVSIAQNLVGSGIGLECRIVVVPPGARRTPALSCSRL